jgi:hypothetical protein
MDFAAWYGRSQDFSIAKLAFEEFANGVGSAARETVAGVMEWVKTLRDCLSLFCSGNLLSLCFNCH